MKMNQIFDALRGWSRVDSHGIGYPLMASGEKAGMRFRFLTKFGGDSGLDYLKKFIVEGDRGPYVVLLYVSLNYHEDNVIAIIESSSSADNDKDLPTIQLSEGIKNEFNIRGYPNFNL